MNSVLMISKWGKGLGRQLMKPMKKKKPEIDETARWNITRGDLVQVVQGPSSGEKGKVLVVLRNNNRVIVENVNVRRRIVKAKMDGSPGKIVEKPCSVHYSNVMLIDPSNGLPTKVSRKYLEDGTKVRVSKKTGTIIPKVDPLFDRKPRPTIDGAKDTKPEDVFKVTFDEYESYLPYIYANERNKSMSKSSSNS